MDRHEIRIAPWRIALTVLGMATFVVLGVWMIVVGSLPEKAVGLVSIVFFGGFGAVAMYRRASGQGRVAVSSSGIEMTLFDAKWRLIRWGDVDAFGTLKVARQEFTTIRLKSYASLLEGLTDEEARSALGLYKSIQAMGYATVAAGAVNFADVSELLSTLSARSMAIRSLAGMLQDTRAKFGAEVLLGWNMRDRKAAAFAEYLEACRRDFF